MRTELVELVPLHTLERVLVQQLHEVGANVLIGCVHSDGNLIRVDARIWCNELAVGDGDPHVRELVQSRLPLLRARVFDRRLGPHDDAELICSELARKLVPTLLSARLRASAFGKRPRKARQACGPF